VTRLLVLLLSLAAFGAAAPAALADGCGIPETTPLWVDFGGHNAPITPKAGLVIAVASGTDVPQQMRAAGASTVLFDLNFNKRVGTTSNPADPSLLAGRAQALFDYAVQVTGCATPVIAENELAGAQTPTPWSVSNAGYRSNVYEFLKDLSNLGATPLLSIANPPYTSGDALYWWQEVSKVAILLRQVYFTKPNAVGLYKLGPVAASRSMRQSLRGLVDHLTQIGIPASRIALEMQFTSSPGLGQRAGLQPATSWLEVVKLEALAVKAVATQFRLAGIWSWGWASFNANATPDPDKPAAACVWLWARDPTLCDGPTAAGPGFDTSLTEGQLDVPVGERCVTSAGSIDRKSVGRYTAITGDGGYAASVLLEQLVLQSQHPADPADVDSAERAVIAANFGGNRSAYWAALAAARVTIADARTIIAARLERDNIEAEFHPALPTSQQVDDFLATYENQEARLVKTSQKAPWIGGAYRGWAISTLAPSEVFTLSAPGPIDTPDGTFDVTSIGPPVPLGLLPRDQAVAVARAVLERLARDAIYRSWLHDQESHLLATASCLNDQEPTVGATDLSQFVPFLLPS